MASISAAFVRIWNAHQTLGTLQTINVAWGNVDPDQAAYTQTTESSITLDATGSISTQDLVLAP